MNADSSILKYITILALITGTLLLIPLIAMQFTEEVVWSLSDFIIMGSLIFGTGLAYKLVTRSSSEIAYRAAVGLALAGGFLLIWVNGAVGIIGNEGNPANLMYLGVLAVGIIGAIAARFHPQGLALTLFLMAFAQAVVPVIALMVWPPSITSWGAAGVTGVFMLNAIFVVLFAASALLFRYTVQKATAADVNH